MKNNKRPQTPKDSLNARTRAEVDRARSNAGQPHRLKTDYTRKTKEAADVFRGWIARYGNDEDYGQPKFIEYKVLDHHGHCVVYEGTDLARGVATGIEEMAVQQINSK